MMNDKQLFYLMQIAGGTFPSGGFSQSWGLETYVANGKVSDEASFKRFMETYLAVSYTHLDVYKRQLLGNGSSMLPYHASVGRSSRC